MKILFIYLSDFTGNSSRDRLSALLLYWINQGHSVNLLTTKSTEKYLKDNFNNNQLRILTSKYIKELKNPSLIKIVFTYLLRLNFGINTILKFKYDYVYSLTGLLTEIIPGYLHKIKYKSSKWIVLIDNLVPKPTDRTRGSNFIIKLLSYSGFRLGIILIKNCDKIFTVNKIVSDYLCEKDIRNYNKIFITTNGINIDYIKSINITEKCFDAIFMGRLDHAKGLNDLIKIWEIININSKIQYKLAIAGSGTSSFEKNLKKLVKEKGLENNIYFLGFKSGKDKIVSYKSAKLFIFPSKDESYPIVILEALACGLRVITYDLSAYKNIFPEYAYKAIELNNIEQFAKTVLHELEYIDIKRITEGQKFSEKLDWQNVIKNEYMNL